ncbi:TonB-dependent receptor plug domain-containing protein [Stenotrophomonas rhizophila]
MRITSSPGRSPRPSRLCIALLAAGLVAAPAFPAMAQANTPRAAAVHRFDIPAQPLADALRTYMRQSGVQVAWPAALTEGVRSSAVNGDLDAQQALQQLLRGSGLVMRSVGSDAVTPEPAVTASREDGVIVTDALRVAGEQSGDGGSDAARALDVYRTAGSSVYVPRATIERFRGTSAADIVKGVVGVTAGDPRTANALDLNIRGIQGQSRIPVIIDGGQSSMDTYRGYAGQSQRTYLDPDLISSLTVTKGPSTGRQRVRRHRRRGRDGNVEDRRCAARGPGRRPACTQRRVQRQRTRCASVRRRAAQQPQQPGRAVLQHRRWQALGCVRPGGRLRLARHRQLLRRQARLRRLPADPAHAGPVEPAQHRSVQHLVQVQLGAVEGHLAHRRHPDPGSGLPPLQRSPGRDHGLADHPRGP